MSDTGRSVRFVQTCGACPEQYNAFLDDEQIGYVRLRHGYLRVDYPECGGEAVMGAELTDWDDQGSFASDEQREQYLKVIEAVLLTTHTGR